MPGGKKETLKDASQVKYSARDDSSDYRRPFVTVFLNSPHCEQFGAVLSFGHRHRIVRIRKHGELQCKKHSDWWHLR